MTDQKAVELVRQAAALVEDLIAGEVVGEEGRFAIYQLKKHGPMDLADLALQLPLLAEQLEGE